MRLGPLYQASVRDLGPHLVVAEYDLLVAWLLRGRRTLILTGLHFEHLSMSSAGPVTMTTDPGPVTMTADPGSFTE